MGIQIDFYMQDIRSSLRKTFQSIQASLPILMGVLLVLSILNPLFKEYYPKIFTGNYLVDPLIGTIAGSFSFGIPIASYVVGGELLKEGVSLLVVTAFIFSWTTVGIPMIFLESAHLGKRFAFMRNALNFFLAILIAMLTTITLRIF